MNRAVETNGAVETTGAVETNGLWLSVVVALGPNYDVLPPAIASALAEVSTRADAELLVVDDQVDGSLRDELAALGGSIRIRHNLFRSLGTRGALAAGATSAHGQLLVFLAAEATLAPGALDRIAEAFHADPGLGFVQCRDKTPPSAPAALGEVGISSRPDEETRHSAPVLALRALALCSIGGPRALYRMSPDGEELAPSATQDPGEEARLERRGPEEQRFLVHREVVASLIAGRWRGERLDLVEDPTSPLLSHWGAREPDQRATEQPVWIPLAVANRPRPGVNVVGLLEAACGLGDAGRRYVEAIAATGIEYATYAYHGHTSPRFDYAHHGPRTFPYDLNLFAVNADTLPQLAWFGGPELWRSRYTVGLWFWELEELSASIVAGFGLVNELWVATRFLEKAFSAHTDRRVVTVPLPVRRREGQPARSRGELGLPEAFTFLTIFDFGSIALRKNCLGVIRAFTGAFAPGEGPVLVLKTLHAGWDLVAMHELEREIGGRRDIIVLDGYLSDEVVSEMLGSADCFVSLHRSEGFGLTPADAMAWGRPVIATGYSGNLDFMTETNSYLVDWERGEVPADLAAVYPTGAHWAEPRLEHASRLFRRVYEHPEEAAARGARAQQDIRRTNSLEAAAAVISRRVEEVARLRRAPRPSFARPLPPRRAERRRPVTAGRRG